MQRVTVLCCVVLTLCAARLLYARRSAVVATTHTVAIDGVKFDPETITVKVGDTVVWINKDPSPIPSRRRQGTSIRAPLRPARRGAIRRPGPACSHTSVRFTRRCKRR